MEVLGTDVEHSLVQKFEEQMRSILGYRSLKSRCGAFFSREV
jgi:hypothetical protein